MLCFLFRQLCDMKTCAFVVMGIGNKIVWAGGGMGRGHQADSVLYVGVRVCVCACVCVCVFVGRRVGWVGMIRHQMLF